jgi:hypothetical protein
MVEELATIYLGGAVVVHCVHLRGTNFYFTGKAKYKSSEYQPRHQLLTFPHILMQPCDFLVLLVVVLSRVGHKPGGVFNKEVVSTYKTDLFLLL